MIRYLLSIWLLLSQFSSAAQLQRSDSSLIKLYRATPARINNLVHTKLQAKFDFNKSYMHGKVWITLKPHFYPTDSLALDAKGMDIHKVAIVKNSILKDVKYTYDKWQLKIHLDKLYKGGEQYTVYIDYTSKPAELSTQERESHGLDHNGGLNFVNPLGLEKDKPIQIWTQGETEQNSTWLPTIDRPNQKSTQEIYLTVPNKFTTLSNGKLISAKKNADGTRTDYWRMDLPHAPYLFFIGVGEYAVVKDSYKNKEVSYYVEKSYAPLARKLFGVTPEMMAFFSRITGVDYPWDKHSSITTYGKNGAMENTTATTFSHYVQRDARDLSEGNGSESLIAHELFHHWFGDYVTTESWSNITLNESFADLGETLWFEYKYGKDAGDAKNYVHLTSYLRNPENENKELVRYHYAHPDDAFDAVGYEKGSSILSMLRNYVGDSAFFRSLNLFLVTHKFKAAEAHQLRLIFEEVTGQDLNWFWNQWYFGSGHPEFEINNAYDAARNRVQVIVRQVQKTGKVFTVPVAIDMYNGAEKVRHQVWVKNLSDTFYFDANRKPDLINFDGDKKLVAERKDNKSFDEYLHQYKYAANYVDRLEAIEYASKNVSDPKAIDLLKLGLQDKFYELRNFTISKLNMGLENVKLATEPLLIQLAKNDPKRTVKGNAIGKLIPLRNSTLNDLYKSAINDSSYTVSGNALVALSLTDSLYALQEAKRLALIESKYRLTQGILAVLGKTNDESLVDLIINKFQQSTWTEQTSLANYLATFVIRTKNTEIVKRVVDEIVKARDAIQYKNQHVYFNNALNRALTSKKSDPAFREQALYIESKIPGTVTPR